MTPGPHLPGATRNSGPSTGLFNGSEIVTVISNYLLVMQLLGYGWSQARGQSPPAPGWLCVALGKSFSPSRAARPSHCGRASSVVGGAGRRWRAPQLLCIDASTRWRSPLGAGRGVLPGRPGPGNGAGAGAALPAALG